jgi:hypothetical protein
VRGRAKPTLVLFPGALGDAVCLEPAIAFLAESAPVALHARGGAAEVAALYPSSVTVRSLDAVEIARLFAPSDDPLTDAWLDGFTRIVSFTGAGVPEVVRRLHAGGRGVVTRFPRPPLEEHAADLFLRAAGAAPEQTRRVPRLAAPPGDARDEPLPLLVLLPGSGGAAKRPPRDLHARLAERWRAGGGEVAVVLGPAEEGEDDAWRATGRVARPESVARLAALLAGARAFVGNDSGPSHVAAALGTPGVVLYAQTVPGHFGPRGSEVTDVSLDAEDIGAATEAVWRALRGRLP